MTDEEIKKLDQYEEDLLKAETIFGNEIKKGSHTPRYIKAGTVVKYFQSKIKFLTESKEDN